MKYQNRKRLMMADAGTPEFSNHRSMADSNIVDTEKATQINGGKPHSRQQASMKEVRLPELTMLSIVPIFRSIQHWWLRRAEHHYLICADVEEQRAREAQLNVAYYQRRAAMARSARM